MKFITLLGAIILSCLSLSSPAATLPIAAAIPGGAVVLDLGTAHQPAPLARYASRQVMIIQDKGRWQAIIGSPLDTKPGVQRLELLQNGHWTGSIAFQVKYKNYKAQYLTIKNKNMVDPDAKTMKRIRSDQKRIRTALDHWSDAAPTTLRFTRPAKGRFSSHFGLRRFFNKKPRRPHSGLDIAASRGTPIQAPAPGRVIETGNYHFNGNTVFIDHGQGLVTMYCHMNRIGVQTGQTVHTGDALGTIGSTGRVTGPHLHWSVSLNGTMVEPKLFLGIAP